MSFAPASSRRLSAAFSLSALALAAALTGCGGGGSGDSSPETQNVAVAESGADSNVNNDAYSNETVESGAVSYDAEFAGEQREAVAAAGGSNATVAGKVSVPYPTINNLSVQWAVQGDDNLNGVVSVRFREAGSSAWRTGMALRRVPAGSNSNAGFDWSNRHSGSILGLKADTAYEIELTLKDPDGGAEVRTVSARTRAVPGIPAGASYKRVTPSNFAQVAANAQPGDVLQLEPGHYEGFTFSRNGTAAKRIVIRSEGGAVINGNVDLAGREYVNLHGLTIKGRVRFNGSKHLSITRNTVKISGDIDGISSRLRSENAYIADNVVSGPTPWAEGSLGVYGNNGGEGIIVTGPGHVIQNNHVKGFRDNISLMERSEAEDQYSIDIVNNDIEVGNDDGIEADYCFHNCRIMGNRIRNSFIGVSSQPSLGGPTYVLRNVMYNVLFMPFKLHNGSVGNVIVHNTVVKNGDALGVYSTVPFAQTLLRNNLFIGGESAGSFGGYSTGKGKVVSLQALDHGSFSMDYDALGSTTGSFSGRLGDKSFSGVADMQSRTTAKHSIAVGLDVFAAAVAYPSQPMKEYAMPDLRLKRGAAAENKAVRIPNVNDRYSGSAPDMGALEVGAPQPVYGPRR